MNAVRLGEAHGEQDLERSDCPLPDAVAQIAPKQLAGLIEDVDGVHVHVEQNDHVRD